MIPSRPRTGRPSRPRGHAARPERDAGLHRLQDGPSSVAASGSTKNWPGANQSFRVDQSPLGSGVARFVLLHISTAVMRKWLAPSTSAVPTSSMSSARGTAFWRISTRPPGWTSSPSPTLVRRGEDDTADLASGGPAPSSGGWRGSEDDVACVDHLDLLGLAVGRKREVDVELGLDPEEFLTMPSRRPPTVWGRTRRPQGQLPRA